MVRFSIVMVSILLLSVVSFATVPKQINHQGVVRVNGNPFEGQGLFRFAIVDADTAINLWSNDGTIVGSVAGIPADAVSLPVINGVYSVNFGDTSLTNMTEIASSVFNAPNTILRIWFDDGVNGLQQLTPDQTLTAAPYAHKAAIGVPPGTMVAFAGVVEPDGWSLCDGRAVLRAEFPDLFNAISDTWGVGDGTTTFNIPDMRGRFIRGVERPAGSVEPVPSPLRDPNGASRTIGSIQGDSYRSHSHGVSDPGHVHGYSFGNRSSGNITFPSNGDIARYTGVTGRSGTGISITAVGGSETRPLNINANWIIKH